MKFKIIFLVLISLLILIFSPFLGKYEIGDGHYRYKIDSVSAYESKVIKKIRIPQILMAFFVGFILSICGLLYQTMFQNDLASPFTLGVSSGTAFGATIALKFNIIFQFYCFSSVHIIAFISGLITILLLILLPSIKRVFDNFSLLLTGVSLNFFFSALILLIYYISNFSETFKIHRWLMGSIDEIGFKNVNIIMFVSLFLLSVTYFFREDLNLLLLSDETAKIRGLNVVKLKIILLIVSSLSLTFVISTCGPIGFIGIICPHITKLIFRYNHKISIPMAGIFGGIFLSLCFNISRLIIYPSIIPVGVITSCVGGPFLIYLLYRNK